MGFTLLSDQNHGHIVLPPSVPVLLLFMIRSSFRFVVSCSWALPCYLIKTTATLCSLLPFRSVLSARTFRYTNQTEKGTMQKRMICVQISVPRASCGAADILLCVSIVIIPADNKKSKKNTRPFWSIARALIRMRSKQRVFPVSSPSIGKRETAMKEHPAPAWPFS